MPHGDDDDAAAAAEASALTGTAHQGDDDDDDDVVCPLCFIRLPMPTWQDVANGRRRFLCCGKTVCVACDTRLAECRWKKATEEGANRGFRWISLDELSEIHDEMVERCPFCRSSLDYDSERFRLVQALADRGTPWALTMLGTFHRDGVETEKNEAMAVECFRKAAEIGHTIGQHRLGECLVRGTGTEKDVDEAALWFERAAAAGYSEAQCFLGTILSGMVGPSSVPIDKSRAFEMFAAAADQGHYVAQFALALAPASAIAFPNALERLIFWGRKFAMQGETEAQRKLAGNYIRLASPSEGVPATAPIAIFWMRKAATADDNSDEAEHLRNLEQLVADKCAFCNASSSSVLPSRLMRCSGCKASRYCCAEHHRQHWKVHKPWCDEVKAASMEYEQAKREREAASDDDEE